MVRVNILHPKHLADQHLVAEYNEILMLFGTVAKHPEIRNQPQAYKLGAGHITFFKDKLAYLKHRHETLKEEMRQRGFTPGKTIDLAQYPKHLHNDWRPTAKDKALIKARIVEKIRTKPHYYRYRGEYKDLAFFLALIEKAT